ncbi:crinkler (CRN) family protein, putative [Rhizophagus clarus]|uniref:Crinkler (CRN) family protein, putative n=1 Tax=Rhizophagus clarus TaxID=94130 RepID=A0A8H3LBZ2_9GLOM|nr:crinkler (CRN) family protein, putative [Rhizophagus clarus]
MKQDEGKIRDLINSLPNINTHDSQEIRNGTPQNKFPVLLDNKDYTAFITPDDELIRVKGNDYTLGKFYMPTWELEELNECQEEIYHDVTRDSIKEKFERCGGIARRIFYTSMLLSQIRTFLKGATSSVDLKKYDQIPE